MRVCRVLCGQGYTLKNFPELLSYPYTISRYEKEMSTAPYFRSARDCTSSRRFPVDTILINQYRTTRRANGRSNILIGLILRHYTNPLYLSHFAWDTCFLTQANDECRVKRRLDTRPYLIYAALRSMICFTLRRSMLKCWAIDRWLRPSACQFVHLV